MDAPERAQWTYRQLVRPIPPKLNLSNIAVTCASPPCPTCRHLLLRDRSNIIRGTSIPVDEYQIIDTFPDFPALQTSATTAVGCTLCGLLRKTILGAWGTKAQPMLESGVTPLAEEEDDSYEPLFAAAWDGAVRIHRARFRFRPFGGSFQHEQRFEWNDVAGSLEQADGIVDQMSLEFGPATEPLGEEGDPLVGEMGTVLHFKVYDSVDVESPLSASRRNLPSDNTLSERNINLIKGWIQGCAINHSNACQANTPWTPTRLLALDPLRLVETAKGGGIQDDDQQYAALSYARGNPLSDTAVQTSAENVEERKEGVDLAELPRTFRDAVAVCRALGIRYLWIDALCILDDAEDRNREAAMMHKIFGHAGITIAATSAANPQSGFLNRNISAIPAAKIGDKKRYMIFTPQEQENSGMRTADVDNSPWNQDAWALVEHKLSARVVHFARNKIYYECRRALHSEENDAEPITLKPSSFWPKVEKDAADGEQYRPFLYEQWRAFLGDYCTKQLSRQADKLLPVRAVAEQMAEQIAAASKDEYLEAAGMWKRDLAAELLWYVASEPGDTSPKTMPRAKQAPTWSWAHCDAKIGFVRGTTDAALPAALTEKKFHVADVLDDGTLSLQGYSREILEIRPIDGGDAWLAEMRKEYPWDLLVSESDDESVCVAHGALDDPDGIISASAGLMYLHVTDEAHPTGLILALDSKSSPAWRRIGVATIFDLGDLVLDPPFQPDSFTNVVVE